MYLRLTFADYLTSLFTHASSLSSGTHHRCHSQTVTQQKPHREVTLHRFTDLSPDFPSSPRSGLSLLGTPAQHRGAHSFHSYTVSRSRIVSWWFWKRYVFNWDSLGNTVKQVRNNPAVQLKTTTLKSWHVSVQLYFFLCNCNYPANTWILYLAFPWDQLLLIFS